MKFKLLHYNIKSGFREYEPPYELEGKRMEHALEVVKRENPDILVLNEAYFESSNDTPIIMDYKKIFGFEYYVHGNYKNGNKPHWGNAVLSKYPIIDVKNNSKEQVGHLLTCIDLLGVKIHLDVVHVSPIPYLTNKEQKEAVKNILKDKKTNYILTGDFNSLSPDDLYHRGELVLAWKNLAKNSERQIHEMLKRDAIRYVLSKGLIDSYKQIHKKFDFTIPTNFLSNDKSSGIRIDYIFASENFKVIDAGIIKNKDSEQASDHYPIYAQLEI